MLPPTCHDVPVGGDGVTDGAAPAGSAPIRVVIADDHDLYRRGMQVVVELDGTARVVGEASNGVDAVEVCTRVQPEVVLMDVRMPGVGGIEACRRIREAVPSARILRSMRA